MWSPPPNHPERPSNQLYINFPTTTNESAASASTSFVRDEGPGTSSVFKTPAPPPSHKSFGMRGPFPLVSTSTSGVSTPHHSRPPPTNTSSSRRSVGSNLTSVCSSTRSVIEPLDRNTILAIVEGRGQARGEIGIACMDITIPTLILCQFNDTQTYVKVVSKINVFRPYEVLMSATSCEANNPSQLCLQLQKEVSNASIVPIQRRAFNEATGLQKLNSVVADLYSPVVHSITSKYYCLAAGAALLKYIEIMHSMIFSAKSLKVEFQGSDQTCMIDHVTAEHLELLQNNRHPLSNHSLLGILNDCKTPVGQRLLRMSLLQPSCNLGIINSRLDSIEELMENSEMLYGLQDILGRLPVDIEHLIATLIQIPKVNNVRNTQQRINSIIALKQTLELIPVLITLIGNSQNDYFQTVRNDLSAPEFEHMLEIIKRTLHDEAQYQKGSINMQRQRCFAVQAEINPFLDIARKAYCELMDDVNNYIMELSQEININLRLGTTMQRGFHVQFVLAHSAVIPNLPSHFLQVKRRGNLVTFTTEVLISSDNRLKDLQKEIENLTGIVISELVTRIKAHIGMLYKVSEAISNLDLIYSLANYALTTPRCTRPTFSSNTTAITMGRHPILEAITKDPSIPNNTIMSNDSNFCLITGPNMSGKTTYIKQVAALQVLAQIGSFVTADAATFRIAKNILSRIGTGDSLEENSSSFGLEMTEMKYILQNVQDSSLIIIDEFGRATSFEEGAQIAYAIAEELLQTRAFVLFATHHMILTKLESIYPNALNYAMETTESVIDVTPNEETVENVRTDVPSDVKLRYTHRLRRGVTDIEFYGLKLAMSTSIPSRVVTAAFKIGEKIMKSRENEQASTTSSRKRNKQNLYLLGTLLHQIANISAEGELSPEDERFFLISLQQEFRALLGMNCEAVGEIPDQQEQDREREAFNDEDLPRSQASQQHDREREAIREEGLPRSQVSQHNDDDVEDQP